MAHELNNDSEAIRAAAESVMSQAMFDTKVIGVGLLHKCPVGKHGPKESRLVFCCVHTLNQDEFHPVGIYFVPFKYSNQRDMIGASGYYLCPSCLRLQERGKLDLIHTLVSACYGCVNDEGTRIAQIDPQKIKDLRIHRLDEKREV